MLYVYHVLLHTSCEMCMCVCMYGYVHVCMYVHMYVCADLLATPCWNSVLPLKSDSIDQILTGVPYTSNQISTFSVIEIHGHPMSV